MPASVSMNFSVIVLDEFLNERAILVEDLVSHVGNVIEDRLILHLTRNRHFHSHALEEQALVNSGLNPRRLSLIRCLPFVTTNS